MTSGKKILYKLGIHRLFAKPIDKFLATLHFFKFSQWIDSHKTLEINDFPLQNNDYNKRWIVHEYIADKIVNNAAINYLEFGTADCETFYWWLKNNSNNSSRFFGFDTFTGLPEDWGDYKKGSFDLGGILPALNDSRASLFKGLFQETVHDFLKDFNNDKRKIILLDADLYSSTLFVLTSLASFLNDDDILIFDEFSSQQHEYLAYENFLKAFPYIKLTCFAATNNYSCVAFKVNIVKLS